MSSDLETPAGADAAAEVFAGTLITRGQGVLLVTRTGANTRFGRIGASLLDIEEEATPLQKRSGALVARLGAFAVLFCLLVAAAHGVLRGDWIGGALAGITLAVAMLPEEFPMVLAIFMALGAWRLAQRNVLTRRSAVIETLGAKIGRAHV